MIPVVLLAVSLGMSPARAGSPVPSEFTVPQYSAAFHRVRVGLDAVAASHGNSRDLSSIVRLLGRLTTVRLPDGTLLKTPNASLADGLSMANVAAMTPGVDRLDDELRTQREVTVRATTLIALDVILRDARFHPERNPIQRLLDWLQTSVARFLDWLNAGLGQVRYGANSAILSLVVAVLFLGLVALAAILFVQSAIRRSVVEVRLPHQGDEPTTSLTAASRMTSLADGGDFRLALRYLLLGLLLQLQEQGMLHLLPGMTNREYLRALRLELAQQALLSGPLGELVDVFDRTWYGHLPIDAPEFDRCRELAKKALSISRREPAA